YPLLGAGQADLEQAGAEGTLPGDECSPASGAGLLSVAVGEDCPLLGDAVDVGRTVTHHAAVVGAKVPVADVVAPDDEDVRLFAGFGGLPLDGAVVRCEDDISLAGIGTEERRRRRLFWRSGVRFLEWVELPRCRRISGKHADHENERYLRLRILEHDATS